MDWPRLDVWRMSAGRPWQLEQTHQSLLDHLKYSGELVFHLIESVLVREWSEQCVEWAIDHGYSVYIIDPAQGQGYAIDYALKNVITSPYSLKWEDDFKAEVDIPLDTCIELMEKYSRINQICFNKRSTLRTKKVTDVHGKVVEWEKREEYFNIAGEDTCLVLKERWWFGTGLWRTSFIKPIFKYWITNTHNLFNDLVLLPMAGGYKHKTVDAFVHPSQDAIANTIGCYIFGKVGNPQMVEHTGRNDSIWSGKFQKKAIEQGKQIVEGAI